MVSESYFLPRYLEAKKTVDDRALNPHVWNKFWELCPPTSRYQPLELLELGAGSGTMIERILASHRLSIADYTALDSDPAHIEIIKKRTINWSAKFPYFTVHAVQGTVQDWIKHHAGERLWAVLLGHAFLDLFHLPSLIPQLFSLLPAEGVFYFTLNFDGGTIFEPVIDRQLDDLIEHLYHQSMGAVLEDGPRSGSRTGRQLFHVIEEAGGEIAAAGSSDWIVYPQKGGYPADESYFLHHILHFFELTLTGHPELDPARFAAWLSQRHQQVEEGKLVYIAHQLDITGIISDK
ncbi:MAG: class I SAM-dependent methyltransferase [Ardenticatenaceae bacterium]|nr:class I SAM-dependent methyltransferase [Ardenticatenaceae bacterium]